MSPARPTGFQWRALRRRVRLLRPEAGAEAAAPIQEFLLRHRPLAALDMGLGFRGFASFGRAAAEAQAEEAARLLTTLPADSRDPGERRQRLLLERALRRAAAPLHGPEDPAAPVEDALLALVGCDLREGGAAERSEVLRGLPGFLGAAGAEIAQAHPPRGFLDLGIQLGTALSTLLLARGDLEEGGDESAEQASSAITAYVQLLSGLRARATGDPSAGPEHLRTVLQMETGWEGDPHRLLHAAEDDLERAFSAVESAAARLSPGRDWPEVLEGMGEDHPEDEDELLTAYREALRNVAELSDGRFPKAAQELQLRRVPVHLQHLVPFVAYLPPRLDGTSPGLFLLAPAPGPLMEVHCRRRIPLHAAREGVPGSHLAHSLAAGDAVYRLSLATCFGQAWAEYAAEALAPGLEDPGADLIAALAWARRAALAVADLGLQSRVRDADRVLRELSETLGLTGSAADYQFTQVARRPGESAAVWLLVREIWERVRTQTQAGGSEEEAHLRVLTEYPPVKGDQ